MSKVEKPFFVRLNDDKWFDEVILEVDGSPFIRAITRYRFKTSGLSGDEWRTSVKWQRKVEEGWEDFDGPYHDIETAAQGLFPGIFSSHQEWWEKPCTGILFLRKGITAYRSDYGGEPLALLATVGHLPWALIMAGEEMVIDHGKWDRFCDQPGCAKQAVSVYRMVKSGCGRCGEVTDAGTSFGDQPYGRKFCQTHLRRGDSDLDDMDDTYEVMEGPGPDDGGEDEHESPAILGGVIEDEDWIP